MWFNFIEYIKAKKDVCFKYFIKKYKGKNITKYLPTPRPQKSQKSREGSHRHAYNVLFIVNSLVMKWKQKMICETI